MDDISWYDVNIKNEVYVCQGIGVAGMTICAVIQLIRKSKHEGFLKLLFFHSQLKFIIPWSLIITIAILYFNIFGCEHHLTE